MNGAIAVDRSFLSAAEIAELAGAAEARETHRQAAKGPAGRVSMAWSNAPLPDDHVLYERLTGRLGARPDWLVLYYLAPGADIHPHRDLTGASLNNRIRFHIPIITNDQVDFRVSGIRVVMQPGELWCLDTSYVHSVANRGAATRVHLIAECPISPTVAAMLPSGWRRARHDAWYACALTGAFVKAVTINLATRPKHFVAQMRMIARFLRWRVFKIGVAG